MPIRSLSLSSEGAPEPCRLAPAAPESTKAPPRGIRMSIMEESYAATAGSRNDKNFHFYFKECTGSLSAQAFDFDSDG
jgi:hypothetical protein